MTALEEVEDELLRHVTAQNDVLENLATAIAIYGADTKLTFHNTAFRRLLRLDHDGLAGGPSYADVLEMLREQRRLPEVPDFPAFKRQELNRFTALIQPFEDVLHLPDGSTLRRVISPHPLGGLQCTYEDVTDRLALERSYNTLIAVQRETLDHLAEAVAVFGADGRLRLSNPAYVALWGHRETDLAGESRLADLLETYRAFFEDIEDWPTFKAEMQALLTDRQPRQDRIARSDGIVLQYASFPLPDGGALLTYQDVTDSVRVEWALLERNEALHTANRQRSQLVASIAGEIRPRLITLSGQAGALGGDGFVSDRQRETLRFLQDVSRDLMAVFNDIVTLAKVDAGETILVLDTFDVRPLLEAVAALTRERSRALGISLALACPSDIGWMVADARRMKRALFALVDSALRRSVSQGSITLTATRGRVDMVFTVSDNAPVAMDENEEGEDDLATVRGFVSVQGGEMERVVLASGGTVVTCRFPSAGP
ncbi:MAG: PAS/PAC domain-containing protein [Rhodospirillaceae bacterium]|nr:MAG: PAS/PAC domain-containing protein [Rhodospirillaceae bacterium]